MPDIHNKEIRRKNMQAVKTANTLIEKRISQFLTELDIQFYTQDKSLPGKPDFVIENYKAVIFTHGCFWHQHNCYLFNMPQTRKEFWTRKLNQNQIRDQRNISDLTSQGWKVLVIWGCALKGKYKLTDLDLKERIEEWLCAHSHNAEIEINGLKKTNYALS
ncbi:DNA mismatch endonuclease Vsr [uncultured Gilliamella sp.]|uniref:very short patch repair endonuclease n=1 Tax=uncultured Gilliamella sp. TaxID=1193505 RepID=UPI0025F50BC9|nr:DNA mismatch endonuclease Vsr [uncultured Gilliamella sp.]